MAMRSFKHALVCVAVYDAEGVEDGLGPDVAVGGILEEVEAANAVELNAREITEGALDAVIGLTCR